MRSVGEFLQETVAVLEESADRVSIAAFSKRHLIFVLEFLLLHEASSFSCNISTDKKLPLSICLNRRNT